MATTMQNLEALLADKLAVKLKNDGHAAAFLAAADSGSANALLHELDDIFDDGGQYRCEQIVDEVMDQLIADGGTFDALEASGEYVQYTENTVAYAAKILRSWS